MPEKNICALIETVFFNFVGQGLAGYTEHSGCLCNTVRFCKNAADGLSLIAGRIFCQRQRFIVGESVPSLLICLCPLLVYGKVVFISLILIMEL